jgi:hypothetical protein
MIPSGSKRVSGGTSTRSPTSTRAKDIIDLSGTAASKFSSLILKSDGQGNTIVKVKGDGTQFKLIGYDPTDIDGNFFQF